MKLVIVAWLDATARNAWTAADDESLTPAPCVSAGFLVRQDKQGVTVAATKDIEGEEYNALQTIPHGMIVKLEVVDLDD